MFYLRIVWGCFLRQENYPSWVYSNLTSLTHDIHSFCLYNFYNSSQDQLLISVIFSFIFLVLFHFYLLFSIIYLSITVFFPLLLLLFQWGSWSHWSWDSSSFLVWKFIALHFTLFFTEYRVSYLPQIRVHFIFFSI